MATLSKTITAGDQYTEWEKFAGEFMLLIFDDPGSNVVRLQCCTDPTDTDTIITATDEDGVVEAYTEIGTYPQSSPTNQLWWRAGVPTADYSSGSFTLALSGK